MNQRFHHRNQQLMRARKARRVALSFVKHHADAKSCREAKTNFLKALAALGDLTSDEVDFVLDREETHA